MNIKLDKIIWLLEKLVEQGKPQPWTEVYQTLTDSPDSTTNTDPICNCHLHKSGESTGGWYCPVHGQRF